MVHITTFIQVDGQQTTGSGSVKQQTPEKSFLSESECVYTTFLRQKKIKTTMLKRGQIEHIRARDTSLFIKNIY